jgi:hypothetical protein
MRASAMATDHISDGDIQALVDNEIRGQERDWMMAVIEKDPQLYKRYLIYKQQKSLLQRWWKDN